MAREIFVYWKIEQGRADEALAATGRFQADLQQAHPKLMVRLFRREDVRNGIVTLMESYAHPGGVNPGLQAAIEAQAGVQLAAWCSGPRSVEVFDALGA